MSADVEGAVRTWLRTHPRILDAVGPRVFFGLPQTHKTCITLHQSGGSPEANGPVTRPLLSFSCWASYDGTTAGTRLEAQAVRSALLDVLQNLQTLDITTPDGLVRLFDATVTTDLFLPDTSTTDTVPRFVIDAEIRAAALTPS